MPKRKPAKKAKPKAAKKPSSTKHVVNGHDVEFVEGGLYERTFVDGKPYPNEMDVGFPIDGKALATYLELCEGWSVSCLRPPDGKNDYRIRQALIVGKRVRWLREQLKHVADPTLVFEAIRLGAAAEKLRVLKHEDAAEIGKHSKKHAKYMSDRRDEAAAERRSEARKLCRHMLSENPGLKRKKTTAIQSLHAKLKVRGKQRAGFSLSNIRNYVGDLFVDDK